MKERKGGENMDGKRGKEVKGGREERKGRQRKKLWKNDKEGKR